MGKGHELRPGLMTMEHSMALSESAAGGVLTREANAGALERKRRKGERLGIGPIQWRFATGDVKAGFKKLFDLRMRLKIFWQSRQLLQKLRQLFFGNAGVDLVLRFGTAKVYGPDAARFLRRGSDGLGGGEFLFEMFLTRQRDFVRFFAGEAAELQ